MPYLSQRDIEAVAQRVTSAYRKLPGLCGASVTKVDPERLAKDLLGLSIDYHVLSRNGRILGLTAYGDVGVPVYDNPEHPDYCFIDRKTVLIDKSLVDETANKGRYHFTLTHEVCHQIFGMLFPREYAPDGIRPRVHYCSLPPSLEDRWEEWRTNRLTSAVLMPADMVQINMLAFGLGDKLRLLNRVYAPQEYEQFSAMAGYMGVSKKALSIRLKQLDLLDLDYLDSPHEFLSVYPDEGEVESDAES